MLWRAKYYCTARTIVFEINEKLVREYATNASGAILAVAEGGKLTVLMMPHHVSPWNRADMSLAPIKKSMAVCKVPFVHVPDDGSDPVVPAGCVLDEAKYLNKRDEHLAEIGKVSCE